jgi:RNA polymerase-binding transcription factor DksA
MFTQEFLARMGNALAARRKSKLGILQGGGQQALSHSYKDIDRIDFAIRRMQDGQYGLCTNCGTPIEQDRLKAIPETPFCSTCAREIEAH